jgi:hypothetical protein
MARGWALVRGRLRSVATGCMLVLAVSATLATSQALDSRSDTAQGRPFVLSSEHPSFSARFSFTATRAALQGWDYLTLELEHEEYWTPDAPALRLKPEVTKVDGPSVWDRAGSACSNAEACLGSYEVVFRWPPGAASQSVRVEWRVVGEILYSHEPADAARVSTTIDSFTDSGTASRRFFDESFVFGGKYRRVVKSVVLRLAEPVRGPISIERQAWHSPHVQDVPDVLVRLAESEPSELAPATAVRLPLPTRCATSPCTVSFRLVITANVRAAARVPWGLIGPENAQLRATAVVVRNTPW